MHCLTAWGQWAVGSATPAYALPHCTGAVGSGNPVMHCLTACGQWAVELLLCTATPLGGNGLWNSCNALPHCLGEVGSGTPVMHRHTAWGRWAVELLQCTASLPGSSGQCNSCICTSTLLTGGGQWKSSNALPHCLWAVGSGAPTLHRHTVRGRWAVELLQRTASLPRGSGQWNCCHALPHCLGQWAVELLQYTASLPGGNGQCNSCYALPHCSGAVGSAALAMRGPISWGGGGGSPSEEAVAA